ncbi:MAG: hypothetical protein ACO3ST_01295 [Burkholderiaceae bacterium]
MLYRQKPVISEDRLSATWTVEVLILDLTIDDLVAKALARLGFQIKRNGDTLRATREWVLTDSERAELQQVDRANAQKQEQAEQKQQQSDQQQVISELQAQVQALREELELMALVPAKRSASTATAEPGPAGPAGRDGKDGQDLVATDAKLSDLQDVSPEAPSQGWVLTWDDASEQWEPKPPRVGISSIGGGAGGNGGDGGDGTGTGLSFWEEVEEGHLLPIGPGQNIGSLERPIGELYATGQTIFLDGLPLALNGDQRLTFDGNVLAYGDSTLTVWNEGASGELLPAVDNLQSIGSAQQQVRELWMGSGAVYFNSVPLEVDADGRLNWNGNVLAYQSTGTMTQWEESGAGNLRPVVPYGQDLGDATNPVRSIYLGGVQLAVNEDGELTVNGVPLAFARGSIFSQALGLDNGMEGGDIVETAPITDAADGGELVVTGDADPVENLDLVYLQADGGTLS